MRIMGATALSGFAHRTAESASDFATVVRNLIMDVRDSYRPEMARQASALAEIRFSCRTADRAAQAVVGAYTPSQRG